MSLISCAQMVGKPVIVPLPAAAPAAAAAPFSSERRLRPRLLFELLHPIPLFVIRV
jgi:hypothetical protein